MRFILILFVRAYSYCISPLTPASCRFHPTCSSYAVQSLRRHGAMRGSWLTLKRILRCHPFCGGGYDPVPASGSDPQKNPHESGA